MRHKDWRQAKRDFMRANPDYVKVKDRSNYDPQKKPHELREEKHLNHRVDVVMRPDTIHLAELRCIDCNKHIQWINQAQLDIITGF